MKLLQNLYIVYIDMYMKIASFVYIVCIYTCYIYTFCIYHIYI